MSNKFIFQTECRSLNSEALKSLRVWHEDNTTGIYDDAEQALEDCLKSLNSYPNWQYRVVRYVRDGIEVFK